MPDGECRGGGSPPFSAPHRSLPARGPALRGPAVPSSEQVLLRPWKPVSTERALQLGSNGRSHPSLLPVKDRMDRRVRSSPSLRHPRRDRCPVCSAVLLLPSSWKPHTLWSNAVFRGKAGGPAEVRGARAGPRPQWKHRWGERGRGAFRPKTRERPSPISRRLQTPSPKQDGSQRSKSVRRLNSNTYINGGTRSS